MAASLRPGGALLIEDFDSDLQPLACSPAGAPGPEHVLANRIRRGFLALLAQRGADPRYGRTLPARMRSAGLRDVAADAYFPIAMPAAAALDAANVRQVRSDLVARGHASETSSTHTWRRSPTGAWTSRCRRWCRPGGADRDAAGPCRWCRYRRRLRWTRCPPGTRSLPGARARRRVARSAAGRYGRMFDLPAAGGRRGACFTGSVRPAASATATTATTTSTVEAGWPFFGQYVAHDLTADRSPLRAHADLGGAAQRAHAAREPRGRSTAADRSVRLICSQRDGRRQVARSPTATCRATTRASR